MAYSGAAYYKLQNFLTKKNSIMKNEKINLPDFVSAWKGATECISPYKETNEEKLQSMLELLPHGSGIDSGISFEIKESTYTKLVFQFGFHHLNENGYYDGWSYHKLIIVPEFGGFKLNITGKNRNNIKDYLYQLFQNVFTI